MISPWAKHLKVFCSIVELEKTVRKSIHDTLIAISYACASLLVAVVVFQLPRVLYIIFGIMAIITMVTAFVITYEKKNK